MYTVRPDLVDKRRLLATVRRLRKVTEAAINVRETANVLPLATEKDCMVFSKLTENKPNSWNDG